MPSPPSLHTMMIFSVFTVCMIPVTTYVGWGRGGGSNDFAVTVLSSDSLKETVCGYSLQMGTLCLILSVVKTNFVQDCTCQLLMTALERFKCVA